MKPFIGSIGEWGYYKWYVVREGDDIVSVVAWNYNYAYPSEFSVSSWASFMEPYSTIFCEEEEK